MGIQFFSSVSEHLQPTASVVKSTFGRAHLPCWVQTMETMSLVKLCLPFSCQSLLGRSFNEPKNSTLILNICGTDCALQMGVLSKMSTHPHVSLMVNASQIILCKPKVKKDPVTPESLTSARGIKDNR